MLNFSSHRIDKLVSEDRLYSLRALKTPDTGRTLAKWMTRIILVFLILLFVPWQQNIRGTGKVTALNPGNRPQLVQSVIAGQIRQWHVREGQYVEKGDTIITISEVKEKYFDPDLLLRLREQIRAKEGSIVSKEEKASALQRQIDALRDGMRMKIEQSRAKLAAEQVKFDNAKNQYDRNKTLFEAGNIPLTKFQDITGKYQGSEADLLNARIELDRVEAEYLDKISKAQSDFSNTQAELFETQGEVAKLRNEYANMQIRNNQYQIVSPQNGYVVKAIRAGIGETIKELDPVCTIMPETTDLAVELYVKAMDVPLLTRGRKVRIEFDGWPALQVTGWPSVSVGTFGGVVEVIDFVSSRPGEFRVLVTPDTGDEPWPSRIRMGSGIKGWVMLDDVPVWYEIWRQLNGFPPSLYDEPLDETLKHQSDSKEKDTSTNEEK